MAGIAFELQKLAEERSIFGGLRAYGHAAIIVAGPWLFIVLAISIISTATELYLGLEALAKFRIVLIYSFAISLLATAPVMIVTVRMLSDIIFAQLYEDVSRLLLVSLLFSGVMTVILSMLVLSWGFALELSYLLAALFSNFIIGMIWIALAFAGAIRDYAAITFGFVFGLVLSIILAVWSTKNGFGPIGLIVSFDVGLAFTLVWLLARILITFPQKMNRIATMGRMLAKAAQIHWLLVLGSNPFHSCHLD